MPREDGQHGDTTPVADRSLSELVELLEAMREAGWVNFAPPSPGSQMTDTAELCELATGTGREYQ